MTPNPKDHKLKITNLESLFIKIRKTKPSIIFLSVSKTNPTLYRLERLLKINLHKKIPVVLFKISTPEITASTGSSE